MVLEPRVWIIVIRGRVIEQPIAVIVELSVLSEEVCAVFVVNNVGCSATPHEEHDTQHQRQPKRRVQQDG